jgi:hypothetical protein
MQLIKSKNQQIMILGSLALERDSFFRFFLSALAFCFFSLTIHGQGITGFITESFSHNPIPSASITISFNDSTIFNCTTNELGEYQWQ